MARPAPQRPLARPARRRPRPRHAAPAGVEGRARGAREDRVRRPERRERRDPPAARPAQLRRVGAARHDRRPGVTGRALLPDPHPDDRRGAAPHPRDPPLRQHRLRGDRRRPRQPRRRGVHARQRRGGARRHRGVRHPAVDDRRRVRRPRALPRGRRGAGDGLPGLHRRGVVLGRAAPLPRVRQRRLLRLLTPPARHPPLPRDPAPGDAVRRARGGLALVLRPPPHGERASSIVRAGCPLSCGTTSVTSATAPSRIAV